LGEQEPCSFTIKGGDIGKSFSDRGGKSFNSTKFIGSGGKRLVSHGCFGLNNDLDVMPHILFWLAL